MTSADDFATEERQRIIEALASFGRSQMRVATWLSLARRASDDPPRAAAAAARSPRPTAQGRPASSNR